MTTYTGQLVGGPDHGNTVSTQLTEFPAKITKELWLDGEGPNKDINLVVIKGFYKWNRRLQAFHWHEVSIDFYRQKAEFAA